MNDLGSHELPEVVPLSVQALERASVMQSRIRQFPPDPLYGIQRRSIA